LQLCEAPPHRRLQAACLVAWAAVSPGQVASRHPFPLLLGAGCQFALLMGRLILAHLTGEVEGLAGRMWPCLLPIASGLANALAGAPLPEPWLVWLNFSCAAALYVRFASSVADELCELLSIRVFSLAPRLRRSERARVARTDD